MTYYLYIKTHNRTGLKYLGQTSSSDPYSYRGSGTRWKNHIKKHGYDVSTEILLETDDKNLIKEMGIEYSKRFNIVESTEYANLKIEEGDGGWSHWDSLETRSKGGKIGGASLPSDETKIKISASVTGEKNARFGKSISEEHRKNLSKSKTGKKLSNEHKISISESMVGHKKPKLKCPYCDKEAAAHVAFRYHFDNCKKRH